MRRYSIRFRADPPFETMDADGFSLQEDGWFVFKRGTFEVARFAAGDIVSIRDMTDTPAHFVRYGSD